MFACRILLFAALLLYGLLAEALPVQVVIKWPSNTPASSRGSVHVHATRTAGSGANAAPVETEAGPDKTVLNLSDGIWQVQASAPGYWSQEVEVEVAGHVPVEVSLALWPAASLRGEVSMVEGDALPSTLELQLTATPFADQPNSIQVPAQRTEVGPTRAELHCRIHAGAWSCLGPTGLFDVRLEASGYAPQYEWAVRINSAENFDFGRTELRKTTSVFGRVVRKGGSELPGACLATLRPDMARRSPALADQEPEGGPEAKTNLSTTLNARGYFQVAGMTPGRYSLYVGCNGGSAFRELVVQPGVETRIDPPLPLEELTLDVSLMPRTDPAGQPWRLIVDETAPHFLRIANKVAAEADGRWIKRGLMAGSYHIVVVGSGGTSWLQQNFDLGTSTRPLLLRVGSLSVAGRVTTGSRPVHASLRFTKNAGGETATLMSDDNGRFQGLLPSGLQESSWSVEAHLLQPLVIQRLQNVKLPPGAGSGTTWLDLELPAIPVHGSVVSPDDKPQPNVQVTAEDSNGARTTTSTDSTGRFEISSLPPGKYTAVADAYDGSSDRVPFEKTEGGGSELKLVLNPYKRTKFLVVSNQGPVADAAVQVWIAPGVPRAFVRSDDSGHFDVGLPPGTTEVGLTVGAPGYAIKLTRQPIASGGDEPADAHTINLDAAAGTLVLNFHAPDRPMDNSAMLYLVHNGAIQDARTLAGWGTDQAGVGDNASGNVPVTIDTVEPGDYALCVITDQSQVAAIWSGALPSNRCSKGSLDQDETLTLSAR